MGYRGRRAPQYDPSLPIRRVHGGGEIKWQGRFRFVDEAFAGYPVALKRQRCSVWQVYFYNVLLGQLLDTDTTGIRTVSHKHSLEGPRTV